MANTKVPAHMSEGLAKDDLSNVNAATGRGALETPAIPTGTTGPGDVQILASAADADPVELPAGGLWAWHGFYVDSSTGSVSGFSGGVDAGEAEVFAGSAGKKAQVWCWRVS